MLLDTEDKMEFVREIILGHMSPGWLYSHDWVDEMKLPTEKDGSTVRINFYSYPTPVSPFVLPANYMVRLSQSYPL